MFVGMCTYRLNKSLTLLVFNKIREIVCCYQKIELFIVKRTASERPLMAQKECKQTLKILLAPEKTELKPLSDTFNK